VEAKFGSPTGAARSDAYLKLWRERYRQSCADLFVWHELDEARATEVPEQLLRNAAFARQLAGDRKHAAVVALVREADATAIDRLFRRFCAADAVEFHRAIWESIYRLLPRDAPELARLRTYFENKTLNLRAAFRLTPEAQPAAAA
jgi:hypothetical protein